MMFKLVHHKLKAAVAWVIALRVTVWDYGERRQAARTRKRVTVQPSLAKDILSVLNQALSHGHTCLPLAELYHCISAKYPDLLPIESLTALEWLIKRGLIRRGDEQVGLAHVAQAEETIAHGLQPLGRRVRSINAKRVKEGSRIEGKALTDEQRDAIRLLLSAPVAILTGDPGTGKTATIKALTAICEGAGWHVSLTAPTGRAAARLAEATGRPAQTLHRLLHHQSPRPPRNSIVRPTQEVIVVDEASMLDVFLAARLIRFCAPHTRLIFVGDVQQLPPVGPGQVLRDLLASKRFPIVELKQR